MVDYPSNRVVPVPAFVAPHDPAAIARGLADAAKQLEDIFKPAKRLPSLLKKPAIGRLFPLAPLADCLVGFLLPQIPGIHEPTCFGIPMMVGGESTNEFVIPAGWFLELNCNRSPDEPFESHANCQTGNQSFNLSQRKWSYALFGDRYSAWFQDNGPNGIGDAHWYQVARRYRHPNSGVTTFPHYETSVNHTWVTKTRLKPSMKVTGAGRARVTYRRTGLTFARRPGARGEKAGKNSAGPGVVPFLRATLEHVVEGMDALEAVHKALPEDCQRPATSATMVGAIVNCFDQLDWGEAIENLVDEKIEDWFFGQYGKLAKAGAIKRGSPRSLSVRPSTKYGGWSPCLFCND